MRRLITPLKTSLKRSSITPSIRSALCQPTRLSSTFKGNAYYIILILILLCICTYLILILILILILFLCVYNIYN